MSKASIRRSQERKKQEHELSRRRWLKTIGKAGSLALALGASYLAYDRLHIPSYSEAFNRPELRERWLHSLPTKPYITMKFATLEEQAAIRKKEGYTQDLEPWTSIKPMDEKKVGKGTSSILYLHSSVFDETTPAQFKASTGICIENMVKNHELIHAEHFYAGIPNYPMDWFTNQAGELNVPLFMSVSEIVCHRKEFQGLNEIKKRDKHLDFYQSSLYKLALPYFLQVKRINVNPALEEKIKQEAWFTLPF